MAEMKVEALESGGTIIHNPDRELMQLMTWKYCLRLEAIGMRRRGPSVKSIVKKHFKVGRQTPVATLIALVKARLAEREKELGLPCGG